MVDVQVMLDGAESQMSEETGNIVYNKYDLPRQSQGTLLHQLGYQSIVNLKNLDLQLADAEENYNMDPIPAYDLTHNEQSISYQQLKELHHMVRYAKQINND